MESLKIKENLKVQDSLLYVKGLDNRNKEIMKLVIPPAMEEEVIKNYHLRLGHAGTMKLQKEISKNYHIVYFKEVTKEASRHCKQCETKRKERNRGKLSDASCKRGESMSMNVLHMPMTVEGYGYIVVVVDMATNFTGQLIR